MELRARLPRDPSIIMRSVPSSRFFVGNLPSAADAPSLTLYFSELIAVQVSSAELQEESNEGPLVVDLFLPRSHEATRRHKGYAFVQ